MRETDATSAIAAMPNSAGSSRPTHSLPVSCSR